MAPSSTGTGGIRRRNTARGARSGSVVLVGTHQQIKHITVVARIACRMHDDDSVMRML